jgi:hypothetical protein
VKPDLWEDGLEVNSDCLMRFSLLAAFLSGCGILFTQLVVCAEFDKPSMGVQVITSLLVTCCIIAGLFVYGNALSGTLVEAYVPPEMGSFDLVEDIRAHCGCCNHKKESTSDEGSP